MADLTPLSNFTDAQLNAEVRLRKITAVRDQNRKDIMHRITNAMQAAEELGAVRDLAEYTSLMNEIIAECNRRKAAAFVNEIEVSEEEIEAEAASERAQCENEARADREEMKGDDRDR
jgi:hypothetical protein